MSLKDRITQDMKEAMKAKDKVRLESVRAIKSAIMLAETEKGAAAGMSEGDEIKLLQKLQKQRKDSIAMYKEQGREDLASEEAAQLTVIEGYLPEPLSEEELAAMVDEAIAKTGASGMGDMGKVMGIVNARAAGRAEGKVVADLVKAKLNS
ncbi:MAG: GatB/YqeY domain-containing protein [Flavobacteriales bacterium]|nr:GatB/YqeY domain-containing protein [Flavobacteriales bacterium]